jgi:hypothetical protein
MTDDLGQTWVLAAYDAAKRPHSAEHISVTAWQTIERGSRQPLAGEQVVDVESKISQLERLEREGIG